MLVKPLLSYDRTECFDTVVLSFPLMLDASCCTCNIKPRLLYLRSLTIR